jgi:hypothetical protein
MTFCDRSRRGVTAAEIMISVMICGVVIVPLITLLVQERTTTVRGHLSFMAYLAAREEVGDIRFRLAAGVDPTTLAHPWTALKDSSFKRLQDALQGGDPGLKYEAAQERIETRVEFQPDAGGLKIGKLSVRYAKDTRLQAKGEDAGNIDFSFGVRKPGPVECTK